MKILIDLLKNPVFLSAGGAWLVAQALKNLYEGIRYGFHAKRLTGGGGMPSAHSATVTGLAVGCLLTGSAQDPSFAVALFLAMVVIYDALGVRLETGKEAAILNRLRERDLAEGREPLFEDPLEEHMGHTLPEVIAGILIGIGMGCVMSLLAAPALQAIL